MIPLCKIYANSQQSRLVELNGVALIGCLFIQLLLLLCLLFNTSTILPNPISIILKYSDTYMSREASFI